MVSRLSMAGGNGQGRPAPERLRGLAGHLCGQVKGQEHALSRVASVLMRGELGVTDPDRPKGSFLFVGPTGVGKTETTKVCSHFLFSAAPITFDMSEYQLQSSVEKFIGGKPDDPGLLGRALRGVQSGVVLFDEIEKAHSLVLDLFLQILWEGRVTLATGEVLNFCPFYLVFTSNLGSSETMRMENAPFASVERTVMMRIHENFRPELVGRLNDVIVFRRLDYAAQRAICEDMIARECARLAEVGHRLEVTPSVVEFLMRAGYHRLLGARPMRGAIERFIQEAVVNDLLAGGSGSGALGAASTEGKLTLRRDGTTTA